MECRFVTINGIDQHINYIKDHDPKYIGIFIGLIQKTRLFIFVELFTDEIEI